MIEFVYFDVGGVAISDFSGTDGWSQLKKELGITPEIDSEFMEIWEPYEQDVVVGKDVEALLPIIRKRLNLNIPEDYSLLNGFVSRFAVNKLIWPLVDAVKKKNAVGLLTNMYPGMLDAIVERDLLPPVEWDAIVESSVEKLKKPDAKFFALAEQKAKFSGQEILFIDNTIGHVEAARNYGWKSYYYDASDHQASCNKLRQYLVEQKII